MTPKRTRDQAVETRELLLLAGRTLFGANGFARTKATDIAEMAGVTRGALLHHFVDKTGLFAAVMEVVEVEVAESVVEAAGRGSDPLEWLRYGFDAFLKASVDPGVTQIMLIDGPSVLGWDAWEEIDSRYAYQPTVEVVSAAIAAGLLAPEEPEVLAHLLLGALAEAATVIGRSDSPESTRALMSDSLGRLLDYLSVHRPDSGL